MLELVISAEARELYSQQKMQPIESNLDELEHMKAEVEKLTKELRSYEANDQQTGKFESILVVSKYSMLSGLFAKFLWRP